MSEDQGRTKLARSQTPERLAFNLSETYAMLGLGETQGRRLVREKKIRVVKLGDRSPRVTKDEIARILREGIE